MTDRKFRIPRKSTIPGRSSSLRNAFIASVMPYVPPSKMDFAEALKILEMNEDGISCVYCGGAHTEWDHLRPFVDGMKPTGYYTTIYNLVPACGKCNQSKGKKDWLDWMQKHHKNMPDLANRIRVLTKYAKAGEEKKVNPYEIVGLEVFESYMELCNQIVLKMKEAHTVSCDLREKIIRNIPRQ